MKPYPTIGVIGLGKVGGCIRDVLSKYYKVVGYDKYKPVSCSFSEVLDTHFIFICTPTQTGEDGRLDCDSVTDSLIALEKNKYMGVAVVKSTLKVGYFSNHRNLYNLHILYSPEFLHEKNRWVEYEDPMFIVVAGYSSSDIYSYFNLFTWVDKCRFEIVSFREAELIKLIMNGFATTKISFWNTMRMICDQHGADVSRIRDILRKDVKRWSDEYTNPFKGAYGGGCLPKDTKELIHSSENTMLLEAVDQVNEVVKKEDKHNG